ncbi:MAG: hypothetical protein PHD32_05840 [Eubacteriales bacterium]|nr:hypothetical protein [Eubacteriales bacterium]
MRLFHVSEDAHITRFQPRPPTRPDLDPSVGLVWAINERCLPNFLTPRDCPRVTYHEGAFTTAQERAQYFSSPTCPHVVAIESGWFPRLVHTTLYLYEFDPTAFVLQDETAGYYVSSAAQTPLARHVLTDLPKELFERHVELRVVDNLWPLRRAVQATALAWSMCRMAHALPAPNTEAEGW